MTLEEWVNAQSRGAMSRLSRETSIHYTTIHGATRHGRPLGRRTALAIHKATGGKVSLESLIVGSEAGEAAE